MRPFVLTKLSLLKGEINRETIRVAKHKQFSSANLLGRSIAHEFDDGGCAMSCQVFVSVNQEVLMEKLARATRRACYAAPGIHDWVAEAVIQFCNRLGHGKAVVITDSDPFVMQVGYGSEQALRRLHEAGIPVRIQPGLRIGIVVADDFAAVFGPPAHNIELFPEHSLPNAVELSSAEAFRLLSAIVPGWNHDQTSEIKGPEPEIGVKVLTPSILDDIRTTLKGHPPVRPDLERQMRVINSTFQIVKITFNGANLSHRKLQLDAESIGIADAELRRHIGATFRVFPDDVDFVTRELRRELDSIKKKHNLKPLGDVGQLVLARDRAALEKSLQEFQTKVKDAQRRLHNIIAQELKRGEERLRGHLRATLQSGDAEAEWIDWKLDALISKMKFPRAEDVLSDLELEWNVFHVSEQMLSKEEFAKKVEEFYGEPIEKLATIEPAVGVRGSSAGR